MSIIAGKKILIFQQRSWGKVIGRFLARKLSAEGARLAALTFKKSTHELIENQPDVTYELIINNDEVMADPKKYLGNDDYSLEEICQDIGVKSIWPIVSTLRNHVKSYGEKYYYSFRQNVSDEEIVYFVKALYKYTRLMFDTFKPDIIIAANFVAFPHIMFNLYAKKHGAKMMAVTDSKVRGMYLFTYNYNDDEGAFYNRVDALNNNKAKSANREKAKQYIGEFRKKFKIPSYVTAGDQKTFGQKIRFELAPFMNILRWYRRKPVDYLESTGITLDYRPPRIILRDHFAEKHYKKFADTYSHYYKLEDVGKYVYFPLQFQPEASIDVQAPYHSNQIETARLLAMSLPGDYTLVVKEHPAMVGKRPPSYLEKVARTVNVKLIDYRTPSEKVLRGAALVISPNSTTLAEAAFLGKPAIQLGNLGTTLKLPNVTHYSDLSNITEKIIELVGKNLDSPEYERRLENYVSAIYDTGFDVDYLSAWEKGRTDQMELLWQTYKKEIERVIEEKK